MPFSPEVVSRARVKEILYTEGGVQDVDAFHVSQILDVVNNDQSVFLVIPDTGKNTLFFGLLATLQALSRSGMATIVVQSTVLAKRLALEAEKWGIYARSILGYSDKHLLLELRARNGIRVAVFTPETLNDEAMYKFLTDADAVVELRWFLIYEAYFNEQRPGSKNARGVIKGAQSLLRKHQWSEEKAVYVAATSVLSPKDALLNAYHLKVLPGFQTHPHFSADVPNVTFYSDFVRTPLRRDAVSFPEFAWIIPLGVTSPEDIPKTIVFCENDDQAAAFTTFLSELMPASIPNRRRVAMWSGEVMSDGFRASCWRNLQEGTTLRIVVALDDTVLEDFDCRDVRRVVQLGMPPSMEVMMQRIRTAGRDGEPATAYTFAPEWAREVQDVTTLKQLEDSARRAEVDPVVLSWFNATRALCPRKAYLASHGETCVPPPRCCQFHSGPRPRFATVSASFQSHWDSANSASLDGALEPDGTFLEPSASQKWEILWLLNEWRVNQYVTRFSRARSIESFMPTSLLKPLAQLAHLCSNVDRLRVVVGDWDHLATVELGLLKVLHQTLEKLGLDAGTGGMQSSTSESAEGIEDEDDYE